jgi:hypothetical protein
MKSRVFWDVVPCSHVEVDRRFRGGTASIMEDDGGSTHLRNVGLLQRDYTALHPRRLYTSTFSCTHQLFNQAGSLIVLI